MEEAQNKAPPPVNFLPKKLKNIAMFWTENIGFEQINYWALFKFIIWTVKWQIPTKNEQDEQELVGEDKFLA